MNSDTRAAIRWSFGAASWVACAIAGAKFWPKHPFAGGAIGVIVVAPAINAVVNAVLPKASDNPLPDRAAVSRPAEGPRANYTEVPIPATPGGVANSDVVIAEAPRANTTGLVYMGLDRSGNPIYRPTQTRGTQDRFGR